MSFTSGGGTAPAAAAYAIEAGLKRWDPDGAVLVEHVLETASVFTRAGVALYNWIQRHGPWMHQIYWRVVEFGDLTKPGTLLTEELPCIRHAVRAPGSLDLPRWVTALLIRIYGDVRCVMFDAHHSPA